MYWQLSVSLFAITALAGCSNATARSADANNHPASPAAQVSPEPARSTTLRSDQTTPAVTTESAGGHSHAGHETAPAAAAATTASGQTYICPMHPEVTSTDPNTPCPKCGMKINKPKPATEPTNTHEGH